MLFCSLGKKCIRAQKVYNKEQLSLSVSFSSCPQSINDGIRGPGGSSLDGLEKQCMRGGESLISNVRFGGSLVFGFRTPR